MKRQSWSLIAVLLFTVGCAAVELSRLQSDYYAVSDHKADWEQRRRALEQPGSAASAGAELEMANLELEGQIVDGDLLTIARAAKTAADEEDDRRNRIAFLRLGCVAAWQAGAAGYPLAVQLSTEGRKTCESLTTSEFGAPRDCALLIGIGVLAQSDQITPRIDALEKKPRVLGLPAEEFGEVKETKDDMDDLVANFDTASGRLLQIQGLDPSVKTYFAEQKFQIHCNYYTLTEVGVSIVDPSDVSRRGQFENLRQELKSDFCSLRKGLSVEDKARKCANRPVNDKNLCKSNEQ